MVALHPTYSHCLSADDRISSVDAQWLAFAQENGAQRLTEEAVIGHNLWDFIADANTRDLYTAIFRGVRASGEVKVLPFRCDSPTLRRNMTMQIRKQNDSLVIRCTLVSTEPTQYLRLFDRQLRRNNKQLTMCSVCLRALVEPAGWLEISDAAIRLRLLNDDRRPRLRYTVCPTCAVLVN